MTETPTTPGEPVFDPDCRDGKHPSCVGGICECGCHEAPDRLATSVAEQIRHAHPASHVRHQFWLLIAEWLDGHEVSQDAVAAAYQDGTP